MGIYGCLVAIHGNEDPPGGPVDCTKRYPPRVAQCIRHGLLRWVRVVWRWWGVWLRSWILSRLRYFQTVCSVVAWRFAKTQAGSSRAWMAARIFGIGVAWLWSRTSIGVSRLNILPAPIWPEKAHNDEGLCEHLGWNTYANRMSWEFPAICRLGILSSTHGKAFLI